MTTASVSLLGDQAFSANSPSISVGQSGVFVDAPVNSNADIGIAGVFVDASVNSSADIGIAGVLVWAQLQRPYLVAQAGSTAFAAADANGVIAQSGLLAIQQDRPAALLRQAGVHAWVTFVAPSSMPAKNAIQARKSGTRVDIALAYDPELKCCDIVFDGSNFVLDETPRTVLLMSLMSDRRAHPDDTWPVPVTDWSNPASFTARRGWVGDALDKNGQLAGSRLWEVDRRLDDEQTRTDAQAYIAEAVAPLEQQRGYAIQIEVNWITPDVLGYRVRVGSTEVQLKKALN